MNKNTRIKSDSDLISASLARVNVAAYQDSSLALRMTGGAGSQSRNADFILIAVGDTTPSEPSEPGPRSGPYPTGPLKIPVGGKELIEVSLSYNKRNILDFKGIKNEKSKQKKRRRGYAETSQEVLYPAE